VKNIKDLFFYEEDLTLDLKNVDNQAKQIK